MSFKETLAELMQQNGVSNYKLAKAIHCSQSSPANWLKGTMPDTEKLQAIADYFGVSVNYLLDAENAKSPAPEGAELTELEKDILERMSRLTPEDRVRVDAYIQGLLAAREG